MDAAQVLQMAIQKEIEAYEVYAGVAERTDNPAARTLLQELAREEAGHRRLLEGVSPRQAEAFRPPQGRDLQISEYLEARPLNADSRLQDVLIHAMKREEQAREFYRQMALSVEDDPLSELLEKLATMEGAHKARLELFYDDVFLQED